MGRGLLAHVDILDATKTAISTAGLDAKWSIHFKELITIGNDTIPSLVIWILDDTSDDERPMLTSSHFRRVTLVVELRELLGTTGSIVKTLSPVADKIFKKLCEDETLGGVINSLSLKSCNTMGNSENPKYCGMTLQFEAEYLFEP